MENAVRLLKADPALAAEQAQAILDEVPKYPPAVLLLATARRRAGDATAALEVLDALIQEQPKWANAHFERGLSLASAGRGHVQSCLQLGALLLH